MQTASWIVFHCGSLVGTESCNGFCNTMNKDNHFLVVSYILPVYILNKVGASLMLQYHKTRNLLKKIRFNQIKQK